MKTSNVDKSARVVVTGGSGLVGKALQLELSRAGFNEIITASSKDCDFTKAEETLACFQSWQPTYVFHMAAKVFGIGGNASFPGDSIFENTLINTNVVHACKEVGVEKVVAMGSGCVYPDIGTIDLKEGQIWNGPPHGSEEYYGHAKRLLLSQLEAYQKQFGLNYVYAISGNIYGPNDNFNLENSHVVPSLVHRFHLAMEQSKILDVWGTGSAVRDFSYSHDTARALIVALETLNGAVNVGSGEKSTIKNVVSILNSIHGDKLEIKWDNSKPDGQLHRAYDLSKLFGAGFRPEYSLEDGLIATVNWFSAAYPNVRI